MTEITELNITRFQPEVVEPEPEPETAEVEEDTQDSAEMEEAPVEAEAETPAPRRMDVEDMLPDGIQVDLSVSRTHTQDASAEADVESTAEPQQRTLRMDESEMERSGISSLQGSELSARRSDITGGDQSLDASGLEAAEGGGLREGRRQMSDGGGGSLLQGAQVREGNQEGQEVGLRNLDDFGDDYTDVDPIIHDLIEWMKENPAELPSPVRRVKTDGRWDPSYLTSSVPFHVHGRQFELFLMVKEDILEVHIFLVENKEDATYLIDRGFQQRSSYLRVGDVSYREDQISQVDSHMQQAREEDTEEFYQIFLSWWNSVQI